MSRIAANYIIGQRPEIYLKYSLQSIKWVDECIVVNTGNDDNPNMQIVREEMPKAKIIKFDGVFNFSNARNVALSNTSSDWVLWVDADEVHFNNFEKIVRDLIYLNFADAYQFGFFHFLLDMFHYQSIDLRCNLFRREGKHWTGDVHEHVEPLFSVYNHEYRYHHYGYTKPQSEIYENWRLYWSLNEPEKWKLDEKRDPNNIISDRVTVAHQYIGLYPEVIQSYIKDQQVLVDGYKFKEHE